MPELPEVETIRRGLQRVVLGKIIKKVEVRLPKIISLGPKTVGTVRKPNQKTVFLFRKLLLGQKIVKISRRAKILIIDFKGPLTLLVHLKMTGQLIFAQKGEGKFIKIMNIENARVLKLPHEYTHVIFEFTDGSRLFYNDVRQFGYLRLVRDEDVPKVKELSDYGPEPFSKDFTLQYLLKKAQRRQSLTIKQFLTDPKVLAGIGNIYSDEILYWAKVRPQRKLKSFRQQDMRAIFRFVPTVLKAATQAQGSSVGDFFKVDATEGRYGPKHMVYGRAGEKCKKCGSIIQTIKLGGRTSSYCPKCQK